MNLELNVVRFNNEDVIATSGEVAYTLRFGHHGAQGATPAHFHVFKLETGVEEGQLPAANALKAGDTVIFGGTTGTLTGSCSTTTTKPVFNGTAYIPYAQVPNALIPAGTDKSFSVDVIFDGTKYIVK